MRKCYHSSEEGGKIMRSRRCYGVLAALLLVIPMLGHAAWRSEGPFVATIEEVAVDKTNPDSIYVATSAGGVWRSDDAGQTWTLPGDEMVSRNVTWIKVDPGNPATLWAGIEARGGSGLWRSPDRGKTWAGVRVDQFSFALGQRIAFSASNPRIIFVPSTNLHFRTADSGKTWQSFRVPGQDVYAFAIHPQNPNIVYAGGRGSGHNLSRSQDGGKTWRPFGEGLLKDSSIKSLHLSAASPSTLLARSGFGRLHQSTDGGATWAELDLGLRGTEEIFSLEIDPHDPRTLLAATKQGLRKSSNAGATWRSAGTGLGGFLGQGLAFHPQQKGVVYAGTSGTGLFKSIDGGETFAPLGKGLAAGWAEKVYAPSSGMGPTFAQLSVGFFRMDGPASWTEIQAPFSPGETAKIDGMVFDRDSPKRIYVHKASSWWRSDDGGRVWSKVEVPQTSMKDMLRGKFSEPQFKSLVQDPSDSKILYSGSWSSRDPGTAVFKTIDGGKQWQPAGTGITSQSVTLLRSAAPGNVFAVGGKDGIFRTTDGGQSWRLVRPGEVQDLFVDPTRPERLFAATQKGLFRSTDHGETWSAVTQGLKGDEVAAVALSSDGQVFAGTFHGVFRSTDGGTTWTSFSKGLVHTDVRALSIAGGSPARLYAGTAGGSVYSTELP